MWKVYRWTDSQTDKRRTTGEWLSEMVAWAFNLNYFDKMLTGKRWRRWTALLRLNHTSRKFLCVFSYAILKTCWKIWKLKDIWKTIITFIDWIHFARPSDKTHAIDRLFCPRTKSMIGFVIRYFYEFSPT